MATHDTFKAIAQARQMSAVQIMKGADEIAGTISTYERMLGRAMLQMTVANYFSLQAICALLEEQNGAP